jgi:hypothetical protein
MDARSRLSGKAKNVQSTIMIDKYNSISDKFHNFAMKDNEIEGMVLAFDFIKFDFKWRKIYITILFPLITHLF